METIRNIFFFQSDEVPFGPIERAIQALPEYKETRLSLTKLGRLENARSYMTKGERQLLIIGPHREPKGHINRLLTELRAINPGLVCMSYSVAMPEEPFDFDVQVIKPSPHDTERLVASVRAFLNGKLVRRLPELPQASESIGS